MEPTPEPERANVDLSRELDRAADAFVVGSPDEMLPDVRSRAAQRRRRRSTVMGLAAAAVLAVSGVVVAQLVGGDDGNDRVVSAPATEPVDTEPATSDTAPSSTEPTTDSGSESAAEQPGSGVEPGEPVAVPIVPSVVDEIAVSELTAAATPEHQLYRWKDGVLAVSTTYSPQPLPDELPPEISDVFPPEVQDLFPDGLPPTINEATEILQEAGLLDEVIEVLNANPDVSDAIYSQPTPEPTRTVRFSTDGVEWTEVDAALPSGGDVWNSMASTGERFVVVRPVPGIDAASVFDGPPPAPTAFEIHSSTDLVEWSVQTVPVPESTPGTDPAFSPQVYVQGLAATESGFVFSFEVLSDQPFDIEAFLPSELQRRLGAEGYSYSQGDDGVTITLTDPDDPNGPGESFSFTWDELGISAPPQEFSGPDIRRYVGSWDGAAPVLVDDGAVSWSVVRAVDDVFVEMGSSIRWSRDGVEWTPVELPEGQMATSVVETGSGVAVVTSDRSGRSTIFVGDLEAGDWAPVTAAGLTERAQPELFGDRAMLFADYGQPMFDDPFADATGSREFTEVDGYRYEMESNFGDDTVTTYRLIDVATGEVVVTETASQEEFTPEPFEYLEHGGGFGDSFSIVDPDTGEALVTIAYDDVTREIVHPDGSVTDLSTVEFPEPPAEMVMPEYRVVAFVEGGLVVQPVEFGTGELGEFGDGYPVSIVGLDDMVLIARTDGVITRVSVA